MIQDAKAANRGPVTFKRIQASPAGGESVDATKSAPTLLSHPDSTSQTRTTLSPPPLKTNEVSCPHPADPEVALLFLGEGDDHDPFPTSQSAQTPPLQPTNVRLNTPVRRLRMWILESDSPATIQSSSIAREVTTPKSGCEIGSR